MGVRGRKHRSFRSSSIGKCSSLFTWIGPFAFVPERVSRMDRVRKPSGWSCPSAAASREARANGSLDARVVGPIGFTEARRSRQSKLCVPSRFRRVNSSVLVPNGHLPIYTKTMGNFETAPDKMVVISRSKDFGRFKLPASLASRRGFVADGPVAPGSSPLRRVSALAERSSFMWGIESAHLSDPIALVSVMGLLPMIAAFFAGIRNSWSPGDASSCCNCVVRRVEENIARNSIAANRSRRRGHR